MKLKATRIVVENHNTRTIYLEDQEEGGRAFDYFAGQYLTFRFDDLAAKPIIRSYTMSSAPNEIQAVAVTVKQIEKGVVSGYLCHTLKEGDILKARGPIGRFCYDPERDQPTLVMVAAGSGVTPFVSIMKQELPFLGQPGHPTHMKLVVTFRSTADLICWNDLKHCSEHPQCEVITSLSREHHPDFLYGRISTELLANTLGQDLSQQTFMTCGPQEMMDTLVEFLKSRNVPQNNIKLESFDN